MRYIGVDLHKTNFVVCYLEVDETARTETFPFTTDGLSRFTRQLDREDEVAVEATQNIYHFYDQVRPHVARVGGGHLPLPGHRALEEEDRQG